MLFISGKFQCVNFTETFVSTFLSEKKGNLISEYEKETLPFMEPEDV